MMWLHHVENCGAGLETGTYDPAFHGDDCMMKFTETECRIGTHWTFKSGDDDPKLGALLDWLVFHGFDADLFERINIGIDFSIKRDVENCRVIWVGPKSPTDNWPVDHYIQGETPPLPWPSVLWTPDGYTSPEPAPDLGSKEMHHERSARTVADGSEQRGHLRLADDRPDRPGDHRADHLHRADGHRTRSLAPVTLDALGVSPAVGGHG